MFHFPHFSPFSSIFGPIWLNILTRIVPNLVLVIFWYQLDIPSHPTNPQKLFCFAIASQITAIYKFLASIISVCQRLCLIHMYIEYSYKLLSWKTKVLYGLDFRKTHSQKLDFWDVVTCLTFFTMHFSISSYFAYTCH